MKSSIEVATVRGEAIGIQPYEYSRIRQGKMSKFIEIGTHEGQSRSNLTAHCNHEA